MRIFISYSTPNVNLVRWIASYISRHAQVDFWDESKTLGEIAWDSIYGWIDQSDLVIVIVTDDTVRRAMSVGQEIGYAKKAIKTIIPLVAQDVPDSELGCLRGVTYERITPNNFGNVILEAEKRVLAKKQQMTRTTVLVVAGILAAIFLGGSSGNDEDDDDYEDDEDDE